LQSAVVFAHIPKFDVVSSRRFDYYRANRCRGQDHFERQAAAAFVAMPRMRDIVPTMFIAVIAAGCPTFLGMISLSKWN
jgi:hypothetical protein